MNREGTERVKEGDRAHKGLSEEAVALEKQATSGRLGGGKRVPGREKFPGNENLVYLRD